MRKPTPDVSEIALPLRLAEFGEAMERFAPFEPRPKIAVAVSGGADSVCLAVLALAWTLERQGEIRAWIVDHGLRAGSAAEAALVADRLKGLGLPAGVVRWLHGPLSSRIQERAREARYRLLEEAVARWGGLHLLVAHHADDQAETIAMRRTRRSGPVGLSGMAAVVERSQIRILRPLLAVPKARLVATLQARRIPWVEDPSNADPRFARAALRVQGPRLEEPGMGGHEGRHAQAHADPACDAFARLRLDKEVAAFLAAHAQIGESRHVQFERARFRGLPADTANHLLGRIMAALIQRPYPPSPASVTRMSRALAGTGTGAMTLGGCLVRFGERWVRLRPERPDPTTWRPPVPLAPAPFGASSPLQAILLRSTGHLC